ncbi:3271_t:CDS:2 [Acaulospora colombiana]|uniref:3271_t:CDS:1 n=1 Tax=Acaulospora colombiana TaxID=27376 RepID=A0ACA9KQX9_9GLOM|nr:3271_t:CDS:2 [Acaulospora colombiana]
MSDNKKEAIRFGIEKPINEIVEHLDNVSNTFNEFKSIIEQTIQGPDSVKLFYSKLKWHSKLIGYNNNEVFIKQQFLRGLSPENQIEARRCGLELPLDELDLDDEIDQTPSELKSVIFDITDNEDESYLSELSGYCEEQIIELFTGDNGASESN